MHWEGCSALAEADKDTCHAVAWFRKAAVQGDAEARCTLGDAYRDGPRGVGQSHPEAVAWWRKATEQGDADAQCSLGGAYVDGVGVDQSHPGA
jgi:TPR repeat protein